MFCHDASWLNNNDDHFDLPQIKMCLGHMTMLIIEILMILEHREIIGNAKRELRECRKRVQEESAGRE